MVVIVSKIQANSVCSETSDTFYYDYLNDTFGKNLTKTYNKIGLGGSFDVAVKQGDAVELFPLGMDPDEDNVFKLHKLFAKDDELFALRERYQKGGMSHKESKEILIKNINTFIEPLREKREQLARDADFVLDVLKEGGKRAKLKAEKKMEQVRDVIGVKLY